MENEKQVVELKIKSWKRKVKLAHTMLHKYESKLKRLEKKEQTARAALAKEIEGVQVLSPAQHRIIRIYGGYPLNPTKQNNYTC